MQFTDETPREEYTIAGKSFKIIQPYATGHVLTAGEASQLNQVFAENIRNNLASDVKEAVDAGSFDQDMFQIKVDDYMGEYEMGVRQGGGGRTVDPVRREAIALMVPKVQEAARKKYGSLKGIKASDLRAKAVALLDSGDAKYQSIWDLAKERVEAAREVADITLDAA